MFSPEKVGQQPWLPEGISRLLRVANQESKPLQMPLRQIAEGRQHLIHHLQYFHMEILN
ncbi:hypothetical protein LT85_1590 [Collimonas arenae]|uniref:Uncharacterized protein n=1 Tax=Collimonas arenae TaxID=279058 RepID=A0A0A1F7T3_9BURK|nr:hypothetical protein LT85_1590 [Collimonas arenae]